MRSKRAGVRTRVMAIDRLAGQQGHFLTAPVQSEVKRRLLLKVLDQAAGCWKDEDHPELRRGAAEWVAKLRGEGRWRRKK